jgi:hypothetical protein
MRAYMSAYHAEHRDKANARARAYNVEHREERLQYNREQRPMQPAVKMFREWRQRGCVVCGETELAVMQAHHIDPSEKDYSLSQIRDTNTMATELAKCVPVCANDHWRIHAAMRNGHNGASVDEVIAFLKSGR